MLTTYSQCSVQSYTGLAHFQHPIFTISTWTFTSHITFQFLLIIAIIIIVRDWFPGPFCLQLLKLFLSSKLAGTATLWLVSGSALCESRPKDPLSYLGTFVCFLIPSRGFDQWRGIYQSMVTIVFRILSFSWIDKRNVNLRFSRRKTIYSVFYRSHINLIIFYYMIKSIMMK